MSATKDDLRDYRIQAETWITGDGVEFLQFTSNRVEGAWIYTDMPADEYMPDVDWSVPGGLNE